MAPNERPKATTVLVWPETKEIANAVTLQMSVQEGRALTRTEMVNMLIQRAAKEINQSEAE